MSRLTPKASAAAGGGLYPGDGLGRRAHCACRHCFHDPQVLGGVTEAQGTAGPQFRADDVHDAPGQRFGLIGGAVRGLLAQAVHRGLQLVESAHLPAAVGQDCSCVSSVRFSQASQVRDNISPHGRSSSSPWVMALFGGSV
ncbi:hypothetical protein AB0C88_39445 [Streptomyces chartreusis]|uniref:hypothetical protein n=1 Tax=Streptomyces chartreusis TaxID=1969 RepID=UPI0033D645D9